MKEIKPITAPKLKKDMIKNITMGVIIFLITAVYSLFDIVNLKFDISLITTPTYWAILALNTTLVVLFMLSVRQVRKDNRLNKPDIVQENGKWVKKANQFQIYMANLSNGYNKITKYGLSDKLDAYLLELNKDKKFKLFQQYYTYKLSAVKEKLKPGDRENPRNKRIKKLVQLEIEYKRKLEYKREDVWKLPFKYRKVTISKLFSSINGKTIDDDETNIDTEEGKDIAHLIVNKILWVVIFGAFTGTLIPTFLSGFGVMMIVTIVLKLITLLMAANMSMADADDFVDINIKISLQRRIRILADFNNKNNLGQLDLVPEDKPVIEEKITKIEEPKEQIAVKPIEKPRETGRDERKQESPDKSITKISLIE